ncbi:MAG: NADH-quinone oxidoreductase subunit NuoG, partial [Pseudomonadales bacterium]|nr:NADH-quinone oxidoreductase subunit NuoG [Pseudomonadales bacterium]
MVRIEVDGRSYAVREGTNLLEAVLSHAVDLPYFCWHPALGSVGACRQCAVVQYRDADDREGRLVMACMTPVAEGQRFSVAAEPASAFRASVIEWLMLNHPHDCPVCEEGGECHLQDMTEMTGHVVRRYRGRKRTFRNQWLGPLVNHEMNRCITCYRCTRFYGDYAGGRDLRALGSRDRMYFGRFESGTLESEFAGNLVEVCPTGVFTDRPFAAVYARKWDLATAPSLCTGCGAGCNTLPAESAGTLRRVQNRYHHEINGYFLCDRGRFGSGYVAGEARLRRVGRRVEAETFAEVTAEEGVADLAAALGAERLVAVGSPRASLEDNFLLRELVGAERFCTGLSDVHAATTEAALALLAAGPVAAATLPEIEAADAVLILGEDLPDTAPRTALAVRQAARVRSLELAEEIGLPVWQDAGVRRHGQLARSPILRVSPAATRLDDVCTATLDRPPEAVARIGAAIARGLAGTEAAEADGALADEAERAFVRSALEALRAAKRPLVVSGEGCQRVDVLRAAGAVAAALPAREQARLVLALERCNSAGVGLLGGGLSLSRALAEAADGATLVVLATDLFRLAPPERVRAALAGAARVVVLDELETDTAAAAHTVLPTASTVEATGTFVSSEGRAQRFFAVYPPAAPIRPARGWLADAARTLGRNDCGEGSLEALHERIAAQLPALAAVRDAAPGADYRGPAGTRIPRQSARASGRTALTAHRSVHVPQPPADAETPFVFTMEGSDRDAPAALVARFWAPGWNSVNALTRFQEEVAGPLRGGPSGVRLLRGDGAVAVPAAAS